VYPPDAEEADPVSVSSISKIASESMARFGARQWNLPTVIPRLSVPYGATCRQSTIA
jgi:nucleoside-diphosphate-sugar epimerase